MSKEFSLDSLLSGTSSDQVEIERLKHALEKAYIEEERFWQQRSRILWLHSGDKNSAFFHASTRTRRTINRITVLEDSNGTPRFKEHEITQTISEFYTTLFTSEPCRDLEVINRVIQPLVSSAQNAMLIRIPDADEIKKATFDINALKTPGSDGFSSGFFHSYWEIIKDDIIKEVQQFFISKKFPRQQNLTHIRLIPKTSHPKKVSEYRPIALCNVFYKIIAKILTSRMHSVLPHLISENQSGFVPGRIISDNVLITHEVLHTLRLSKATKRSYMAVKTDMTKAYDRIEWDFLKAVLIRFGFEETWVTWIMECVTSVTYSFLLNGGVHGFVEPSRGLRQGDPLSPCLFVLCSEVLSGLCREAQDSGQLVGVKVSRNSPPINHLLFADDTMFFCRSDADSCRHLRHIIRTYERASGQSINVNKSSITFSAKTPPTRRLVAKRILHIHQQGGIGKYLGLPENFGRRKKDIFTEIVNRIIHKASSWTSRFLSPAGKEVMLKAVLAAIPSYSMSCFKLLISLCKRIQSALTRFWWDDKQKRKTSWVSWDKLTWPKNRGGLGFRDILAQNDSLLAKLGWRLLQRPNALVSKILLSKYCHGTSFLTCSVSSSCSHGWRGILEGREVLKLGLGWLVGDGASINIWSDAWLSTETPTYAYGPSPRSAQHLKVSTLIDPTTRCWNRDIIDRLLPLHKDHILQMPLSSCVKADRLVWLHNKNGLYSVKSGYDLLVKKRRGEDQEDDTFDWKANIWRLKTSPKIRSFLWKGMVGALPVGDQLMRRNIVADYRCKRCGLWETVDHLLFQCQFAQKVWDLAPILMSTFSSLPTLSLFLEKGTRWKNMPISGVTDSCLYARICWFIWKARNELVFSKKTTTEHEILTKAIVDANEWELAQTTRPSRHIQNPLAATSVFQGITCYVDGAWKPELALAGLGFCYRANTDVMIGDFCVCKSNVSSPLMAEALAMLHAIEKAKELEYWDLRVFSDCQVLVNLLNKDETHNDIHSILHDLRSIASLFSSISFLYIPRRLNTIADGLAKSALSSYFVSSFED